MLERDKKKCKILLIKIKLGFFFKNVVDNDDTTNQMAHHQIIYIKKKIQ